MSLRTFVVSVLFLSALTVWLTWPQAMYFRSAVFDHDDPYFSIWRLSWIAHALKTAPQHLYDANIFFPETRTLAYSDAILLEGATIAPLIWAGMAGTTAYNLALFAAIVCSGLGMLVLVRHLTGNDDAALFAAAVYVLLPYRIEHVMHLELQWTAWIPLALWALHRAFEDRSVRFGMLTGLFALLQLVSCVYYGVFVLFALAVAGLALIVVHRGLPWQAVVGAAIGAVITTPVALLYGIPYVRNAETLGGRPLYEVALYSAVPLSYISAPAANLWWGKTGTWFRGNEMHLFPGVVLVALAALAIWSRRRSAFWVYAVLLAFGIEMSFGLNGTLYPWLRTHVFILAGFRAAARFSIVAFTALAVLAGLGFEWLSARVRLRRRGLPLLAIVLVLVAVENASALLPLVTTERPTPSLYVMLTRLPAGPVAEFPMPQPGAPPFYDPVYMMWSTRHWRPLINGYSGYVSPRYLDTLSEVANFPDDRSITRLSALGTRYIVVHTSIYSAKDLRKLLIGIGRQPALAAVGDFNDWLGHALLFELRTAARP